MTPPCAGATSQPQPSAAWGVREASLPAAASGTPASGTSLVTHEPATQRPMAPPGSVQLSPLGAGEPTQPPCALHRPAVMQLVLGLQMVPGSRFIS